MNFFKRFRFTKKKDAEEPSARDRMLDLHSNRSELIEPLVVNCDCTELYNESVDNVPLLKVCVSRQQSPLIDVSTFKDVLRSNIVFPAIRQGMSYSVEVCGNSGQCLDLGENQAPPNVNIFAPNNSIRRPVIQRLPRDDNMPVEFDFYNDIPHEPNNQLQLAEIEFPYIETPSVTSSRLSGIDNYNGPGYVNMNPEAPVPQVDPANFFVYADADNVQQLEPMYPTFRAYSSEPYLDQDPGPVNLPAVQTVSYIPPMIPITEPLSPIIPDLVNQDTPILYNLPVVYIIPVVPLSIQPLFLAPVEPNNFTYSLPAPLAFNCVLRTPFPQFIYSVEPCRDPGCPFSYRYRCPTPQLEPGQTEQRRRTTRTNAANNSSCQFRRSTGFNYQCSNCLSNENEEIEEDTPRRKDEKIPPPVRRLSDKFDSPRPEATSNPTMNTSQRTETSIETVTTQMDSISLNGNEFSRMSQIRVRISARDENHNRGRQHHPRASQVVQFRRNKRNGILKPRNVCFHREPYVLQNNFHVLKSTMIREVNLARSTFSCVDWLKIPDFSKVQRFSLSSSSFQRRPYLLSISRNGPLPTILQEVSVPVINNSVCESMYQSAGYIEHIPNIFICAGWKKGGFDSCEGDSGGPMVIQRPDKRWLLAGIISWGIGCAEPNQPGVYTRISAFRDWINQILQF